MALNPVPSIHKYISFNKPVSVSSECNPVLIHPQRKLTPYTPSIIIYPEPNSSTPLIDKKQSLSNVPTNSSFVGIFLALLSGIFFTVCSTLVKFLTGVDPMELLIFRSIFQVCITLIIATHQDQNLTGPKGSRALLLFQGLIGGGTLVLLFYSFRLLPLGDAATIIFSCPVFVMILSHIWLREPCGLYRTCIVIFLVFGVVFITKPPFLFSNFQIESSDSETESYSPIGYICAISATFFYAVSIVVMRKCKDIHFSVVIFQYSFWSLVISTIVLFVNMHGDIPQIPNQTPTEWLLIAFVAVTGLSGQILVAIALSHEGAGRVAVTRSLDIVLAYVLQVIIFNEVPNWTSVFGAGMVLICVVGMGFEDVIHKLIHGK